MWPAWLSDRNCKWLVAPTVCCSCSAVAWALNLLPLACLAFRGAGTAGLNVPMFIALRRFTLLFTILLERYWLKKSHDWPTLSAMGIMIGGGAAALL